MSDDERSEENAKAAAAAYAPGADGEDEPSSELEMLKSELDQARAKMRETQETLMRAAADYENYKKRITRDSVRERELAEEKILKKLLPVLDNFERGLEHMKTATRLEPIKEGTEATYRQLQGVLAEHGITPMDALGKPFDPKLHDALTQQVTAEVPEGTVVHVAEPGYMIKDRVLRHAKVVVSKAPAE